MNNLQLQNTTVSFFIDMPSYRGYVNFIRNESIVYRVAELQGREGDTYSTHYSIRLMRDVLVKITTLLRNGSPRNDPTIENMNIALRNGDNYLIEVGM